MALRMLALHGYGGSFGSAENVDAMQDLAKALADHVVDVAITAPQAPNAAPHGPAWFSGNQEPLGKVVGFSITSAIVEREGTNSTTPQPLTLADLPELTEGDDVWSGVEGFEASLAFLETLWESSHFDGVLGFSQGAMMAAMLCGHLRHRRPELAQPKFAVLCCGFSRPWPAAAQSWWPPRRPLATPSLHVIGTQDTIVANCRSEELLTSFEAPEVHRHDLVGHPVAFGGHVVPWSGAVSAAGFFDKLAALLRRCGGAPEVGVTPTPLDAHVLGLSIEA